MPGPGGLFVIDANVLIDYLVVDRSVLTLMTTHLGPIHVPRRVLEEIISPPTEAVDCESLGLIVVTEEMDEIEDAVKRRGGGLTVPDCIVLVMAQRRGWTPITNDTRLRAAIVATGITPPPKWGLEMLIDLVVAGHLTGLAAVAIARRIIDSNKHMQKNAALFKDFETKVLRKR
jgi:hypothetical protein